MPPLKNLIQLPDAVLRPLSASAEAYRVRRFARKLFILRRRR